MNENIIEHEILNIEVTCRLFRMVDFTNESQSRSNLLQNTADGQTYTLYKHVRSAWLEPNTQQ